MKNEGFCLSRLPEALGVNGIELVGKQKVVRYLVLEDMTLKTFKTEHCRKTVGTTFSRLRTGYGPTMILGLAGSTRNI